MKLYDLTDNYKEVEAAFEFGEIDEQAFIDTMESISDEITEKLENMQKLKLGIDSDIAGLKLEIDRLKKLIASKESQINSISSYAMMQLKKIGKTSINTKIGKVRINSGRRRVEVDIDKFSDFHWQKFVAAKTTYAPDKKAIAAALDNGDQIDGAGFMIGDDSVSM